MKKLLVGILAMAGLVAGAAPTVTIESAQQRGLWSGIVDVECTVRGISIKGTGTNYVFACTAMNKSTGAALSVSAVTAGLKAAGDAAAVSIGDVLVSNGVYRLSWDTTADLGSVSIDEVRLNVLLNARVAKSNCVQLWANGPYWATTNVGAENPEDFGYYFWWGDTVGYKRNASDDGWVSVKDGKTSIKFNAGNATAGSTYKKTNSELVALGYSDDASTGALNAAHDAATQHWGAGWRMPTSEEVQDLTWDRNVTTTWTTRNGVSGRLVTGKGAYASKSIFLPAARYGYWGDVNEYERGCYWSSTRLTTDDGADALYFGSDKFTHQNTSRYLGLPVRPVTDSAWTDVGTFVSGDAEFSVASASAFVAWMDTYYPGTTDYEACAKQLAANGVNTVEEAYVAGLDPTDPTAVFRAELSVTNGTVYISWTPNLNAASATRRYRVLGKAKLADAKWRHSVTAACRFFKAEVSMPTGEPSAVPGEVSVVPEHERVQLWENGPYWATTNIGAENPEDFGYYFWWGDTVGYVRNASDNGWVSAKDGASFVFSSEETATSARKKKAELVELGYIDNATTNALNAAHDAATQHWGSDWRMPTSQEFKDLIANTTTIWTMRDGVYGRLMTGKGAYASKSIFLPTGGTGGSSKLYYAGLYAYFWSSTPNESEHEADALNFSSRALGCYGSGRSNGHAVRPVSDPAK